MAQPSGNSVALTGNVLIDGLLQGSQWLVDPGRVITYSLNINNDRLDNTNPTPDPEGGTWDATWITAAGAAFAAWENVANIDLQQQPINNSEYFFQSAADLALTRTGDDLLAGSGGTIVALSLFPDPIFVDALLGANHALAPLAYPKPEGDIALDNTYFGYQYLAPGGWGFHTLLHEIGHALGLKHPDDDGGNARPTFTELGIDTLDTPLWTVMNQNLATPTATEFAATPMPLDILAIQHMYGANMSYRTGDDTYVLADDGIVKTIWDAGGNDTISASGLGFGITLDLRPGTFTSHGASAVTAIAYNVTIENAIGTAFNDTINGNDAANVLNGGAGNDTLDGGPGDDILYGEAFDIFQGGAGRDLLYIVDSNPLNINAGAASVEWIQANLGDDVINGAGASAALEVYAGGGSDTVTGGAGADFLWGEAGNDNISSGGGADTVIGGDGNDVLVGHADLFDSFNSVADVLDGGAGDDVLYGEASDFFQGGSGRDLLYIVNSNAVAINLGSSGIEWIQSDFGNDTIDGSSQAVGIEVYSDGGNDSITGSAFADILWSGSGDDWVAGGGGDDVIVADIGVDTVTGGDGNDNLYLDSGDVFNAGAGVDALYITGGSGMVVDFAIAQLEWAKDFVGGDDALDGSNASVALEAYAAGGSDTVTGGWGVDFLWGGAGDDVVSGNAGDDTLVGETGMDILTGGLGVDSLYGNSGNGGDGAVDTFVFGDGWGTDFVFDFDNGVDKFDVSGVTGLSGFGDLTVTDTPDGHAYVTFGADLIAVANASGLIDAGDFIF